MALTHALIKAEAEAFAVAANEMATLLFRLKQLLTHNANQAIDWGAASTPAYITEDAVGNIDGLTFSRQAVSNAIFSLDQVRSVLENGTITQGDHVGNLNQLARPLG